MPALAVAVLAALPFVLVRIVLKPKAVEITDGDLGFELCRQDNVEALAIGSFVKAEETLKKQVAAAPFPSYLFL